MITMVIRDTYSRVETSYGNVYVYVPNNFWKIPPSRMQGRILFVNKDTMLRL